MWQQGRPLPVDWDEPDRVAQSILRMKVKHAVITSVDRDDLADGGSILMDRNHSGHSTHQSIDNHGNPDS